MGAGQVSKSSIVRLPGLAQRLGPVLALSYRLASRIVNRIRAGYPVEKYEDLRECPLILISVPRPMVPKIVSEMASADVDWHGKVVLLSGSSVDSAELAALAARGAATGSLSRIHRSDERRFVVEGHRLAVRQARLLAETERTKVLEVSSLRKEVFSAGVTLATSLFTPLLEASVHCFRDAGIKPRVAAALAGQLFHISLRSFLHAGRKSWAGPLADQDKQAVRRQLDALLKANPSLASYYIQSALLALELFERDPKWLESLGMPRGRGAAASNSVS